MPDTIRLHQMVFRGYHGVYAAERQNGQRFEVDLALTADLAAAASSDRLEDTLDYGQIYALCRRIVEHERFNLIEALAGRIADRLLAEFSRIDAVTVTIRKPEVALGGPLAYAGVELHRRR